MKYLFLLPLILASCVITHRVEVTVTHKNQDIVWDAPNTIDPGFYYEPGSGPHDISAVIHDWDRPLTTVDSVTIKESEDWILFTVPDHPIISQAPPSDLTLCQHLNKVYFIDDDGFGCMCESCERTWRDDCE